MDNTIPEALKALITKKCSKCGEVKDGTEFWNHPRTKDGLQAQCKDCQRKSHRNAAQPRMPRPQDLEYAIRTIPPALWTKFFAEEGFLAQITPLETPPDA